MFVFRRILVLSEVWSVAVCSVSAVVRCVLYHVCSSRVFNISGGRKIKLCN